MTISFTDAQMTIIEEGESNGDLTLIATIDSQDSTKEFDDEKVHH